MNLLVISTSSDVHFTVQAWGRLGIIYFIAVLYTSIFLALGILVSARTSQSTESLVILLLTWVFFVVFIPLFLPSIVLEFSTLMTYDEFWERREHLHDTLEEEYNNRLRDADAFPVKKIQLSSEYVLRDAMLQERLKQEYLIQQIDQIQRAFSIIHISPTSILQRLLESFSGTGFERHLQFLENAKRYARQFREFVVETDRVDPQSLHFIGVREGMSKKPVNPESIPIFEDKLSFHRDFETVTTDLLIFVLYLVVLLSGAYLAFARVEI